PATATPGRSARSSNTTASPGPGTRRIRPVHGPTCCAPGRSVATGPSTSGAGSDQCAAAELHPCRGAFCAGTMPPTGIGAVTAVTPRAMVLGTSPPTSGAGPMTDTTPTADDRIAALEARLDALEAKEAIIALKHRYLRACDAKDAESFRSAFIDRGAVIDYGPLGRFDDADGI